MQIFLLASNFDTNYLTHKLLTKSADFMVDFMLIKDYPKIQIFYTSSEH